MNRTDTGGEVHETTKAEAAIDPARYEAAKADVTAELVRTDAKAATLLTALSLPLGVLVVAVPSHHLAPVTTALVLLGGAGLVAAGLLALAVIRPNLTVTRGTWLYWANCTTRQLAADLAADQREARLLNLSQLTRRKYARLQRAVDVTALSLLVLAAALATALT
ncbi:Pycsar system effector family protein [Kitasatospora sp. HPMI-4]|uniref:Pycsar system effector family protein n=1 Tax=Kitasatospora sp. HPMI-4 TaxID=3448443 RepID=UPI003F1AF522